MFPFSHSVTPAARTHLDAQVAFINDLSKSVAKSFQDLCQLNIQLSQTMLEEGTIAGQQLLTTDRANDVVNVAASRAQPAAEKLRAYQQHVSRVAANAQAELARVAEQHVQETSRTARALADEVARTAVEQTDRSLRKQEETIRNFRDPFVQDDAWRGNGSAHAHGNLQSAGEGDQGQHAGNLQTAANSGQQSNQQGGKASKAG